MQIDKNKHISDRCDLCSGGLKFGKTTLEIWRGQELLVIKDVPSDVCEQCGEAYISANTSERLDNFLRENHRLRPERYLAVPQFSAVQVMEGQSASYAG